LTGSPSTTGFIGSTGATGAQPAIGAQGFTGPTGASGDQGAVGSSTVGSSASTINLAYSTLYATNVTMSGSTLTATNVAMNSSLSVPSVVTNNSSTISLTNSLYANTFILTSVISPPVFSYGSLAYPFFIYVKNATTSNIPISVNGGAVYYPTGPTGCNVLPALSNATGNSALSILYASSSSDWYLY
jgi:hypothetical protein